MVNNKRMFNRLEKQINQMKGICYINLEKQTKLKELIMSLLKELTILLNLVQSKQARKIQYHY